MEDISERKTMLFAQRDVQSVVGGGSLQLEIKRAAEPLAQRETPCLVNSPSEWRVDHELHATAFIEEALGYNRGLRGDGAQNRTTSHHVFDRLLGSRVVESAFELEPGNRSDGVCGQLPVGIRSGTRNERTDLLSQLRDVCREFVGPCRCFATPERNGRWRSLRILYQDAARRDSPDPPGSVTQQHDIASDAFYGEVFIYRADDGAFGLRHHGVQRILWNGAAAGNRCQTTATAGADDAVYTVAMKVSRITSARSGDTFGKHPEDLVEVRACKLAIRIGVTHSLQQFRFIPIFRSTHGYDLLRQNV